jgi:hypothetical protein
MTKKKNRHSSKSLRKTLIKEIEVKLTEALNDFHKKISDRKFEKQIHKAGKFLSKSLAKEHITIVHKKKIKVPKKEKKVADE